MSDSPDFGLNGQSWSTAESTQHQSHVLINELAAWKKKNVPVLIGGDFNVIPEDIDCQKLLS
jgi:exonuclease III